METRGCRLTQIYSWSSSFTGILLHTVLILDSLAESNHLFFRIRIVVISFKGSNYTFGVFPSRLQGILRGSIADAVTECIVYPTYEVNR